MTNRNIVLILLVASLFLFFNIDKPFIGHHDYNGAVSGTAARNYISNMGRLYRYEPWQNLDVINGNRVLFYPHYPPLSFLLFTLSGIIFGVTESSLRLVTVVCSLLMVISIYKIGERLYDRKTGALAAFLTMVTPMFIYFGKAPDHEPIVTALCTTVFYFYLTLNDKGKSHMLPFYIFLGLAFLESWASYFFLFFLLVHTIIFRWISWKVMAVTIGMAASVVILQLLLILFFLGPASITGTLQYGLYRMNGNTAMNIISFTFKEFVVTLARYVMIYFTRILTALSLLWLVSFLLHRQRRNIDMSSKFLIILFLYPLTFTLVFRNLMYIHDFKLYLFLPFIAIASAAILLKYIKKVPNWRYARALVIILVLTLVYMERLPYLKTLLLSSFDSPGYEVGTRINERTVAADKVLLNSKEFVEFYRVFIDYYANRKVIDQDTTLKDYTDNQREYEKYRFIVLVDSRPIDKELTPYLLKNYSHEKTGNYTFVDTSAKKPQNKKN